MNPKITGRVRKWFERDLFTIRETLRAEPTGLWSYPTAGPGRPLMFRMPHPLHPLETIAALRGWGGLEGPNLLREGFRLMLAGELRTGDGRGWLGVTERIAEHLFVPPATVRLLWHVLTPLNVPFATEFSGSVHTLRKWWFEDAGFNSIAWVDLPPRGPVRPNFWTHELEGDVEL